MRTQKLVYRRQSLKLSRLRLVPIFLKDSRGSKTEHAWKITPREKGEARWGERKMIWNEKWNKKSFFSLTAASRPSRVGWFSHALAFRSLYYPWGKMGTTRSPERGYTEKEIKTFCDMTDVFCYPTLENDKCEVRFWNTIIPSPGGSSVKFFIFCSIP